MQNKACNIYRIYPELIEIVSDTLKEHLTVLYTGSMKQGIFLVLINLTRKGNLTCNNYRPIFTLSTYSKIFEKLINVKLFEC